MACIRWIDETHPYCVRCQKSKICCEGYNPRLRYVDERPRIERAKERVRTRETQWHDCIGPTPVHSSNVLIPRESGMFLPTVPPSINLHAQREQVFRMFFLKKMWANTMHRDAPGLWLHESSKVGTISMTPVLSTNALAAAFFGRRHKQTSVCVEAAEKYGHALRSLKSDLDDPNEVWSFGTLAAASALSLYEVHMFLPRIQSFEQSANDLNSSLLCLPLQQVGSIMLVVLGS